MRIRLGRYEIEVHHRCLQSIQEDGLWGYENYHQYPEVMVRPCSEGMIMGQGREIWLGLVIARIMTCKGIIPW